MTEFHFLDKLSLLFWLYNVEQTVWGASCPLQCITAAIGKITSDTESPEQQDGRNTAMIKHLSFGPFPLSPTCTFL